ncbi:glycogen debranching enzyme GlgX [Mycetocola manganoxydans]|uniref:Glycogen debranching enzyme GlgX n=1 Tax=Mycetocola manganoxydans TaxID=699879 RepID=A0A3L6ZVB8_9MICO|nr:glycogen debranching protein GlgX [Mycetocola manganoxydans]RLP71625.1 glycogen debranching enzyme GlgX [Mycetocola manganoxydans]GHD38761.1 glycogen operon protein GlgX homolog [Mycetocola manganoxydans]
MTPADSLHDLGVRLTSHGGELRVYSASADAMELVIFDDTDPNWVTRTVTMQKTQGSIWIGRSRSLKVGTRYAIKASGESTPTSAFNPANLLIDPYAKGLVRVAAGQFRSAVVDTGFDWGDVAKPQVPLDRTVIYEAHAKGMSKLNRHVPEALRGSYAGLAHESTIGYLKDLGVTTVELLPVHAFVSEQRLIRQGLTNYWGYNTLNFFTPHPPYASKAAQAAGPDAILREFKGMVRLLHEAGLEVILDVVYNHTAEEGRGGPTTSLRGLDNDAYYRQTESGDYIDVTGCGNSLDTSHPAAHRLVMDSLRYWANEVQVDGFRFDLAVTLGRDATHEFTPEHPLLTEIIADPALAGVKMISEPWDVGMGGWQTGNFPVGWIDWNDRYRDRVRNFWLSDVDYARRASTAPVGIGGFATRLAGSSNTFSAERGPLASVNLVTAHDGFTLADLVSYDVKRNVGNGESNRDGTDNNRSFNHGAEGPTADEVILATRRKAMRNLLATLLLSAGVPMITAGDEYGRTQRGNNNAYCHDSELTWLSFAVDKWQHNLHAHARRLLQLRRENPALRPVRFGRPGETVPSSSRMDWYDQSGNTMSDDDWTSARNRTLQYVAASTPEVEEFNRILLIVHGVESPLTVTLPVHDGVDRFELLWRSEDETPLTESRSFAPGDTLDLQPTSMLLFLAVSAD